MWTCQHCGEDVENIFDRCWNCETLLGGSHLEKPETIQQSSASSEEEYGRLFDKSYQRTRKLLQQDVPGDQVIQTLQEDGLTREDAQALVEEFVENIRAEKKFEFEEPWEVVDDEANLENLIEDQIPRKHVLYRISARAIARRIDRDDFLLELLEGSNRYAEVWLGDVKKKDYWFQRFLYMPTSRPETRLFESFHDWVTNSHDFDARTWKAWPRLEAEEGLQIWRTFKRKFHFRPSVHPQDWPGIDEPHESVTFSISHVYGQDYLNLTNNLGNKLIQALRVCVDEGKTIYALYWHGLGSLFVPHEDFMFESEEDWPVPPLPNGEYYIFLDRDLSFGIFGHPWEQTMCVFGSELIAALEEAPPLLFTHMIRKSGQLI